MLGSIAILTVLSLSIHEHGMSSHLFISSLIYFSSVLQYSLYKSLTSLVKVITRNFILLDAIVNGIVFLISFLECLLLVYRSTTAFCVLILYPTTC